MNRTIVAGIAVVVLVLSGIVGMAVSPGSLTSVDALDIEGNQGISEVGVSGQPSVTGTPSQVSAQPTLSISPPRNRTAIDRDIVQLRVSGESDTAVSYNWTQTAGPNAVLMADQTATPWLVTPDVHSNRTLVFDVTVSDRNTTETATAAVTVRPNESPTADINGNHQVSEDGSLLLDGSESSDPEGDSLRYRWEQTAGPDAELGAQNQSSLAVTVPRVSEPTSVRFQLTVIDSHGQRDTVSREIIIYPDSESTHGTPAADDTLLANDDVANLTQRGLTHYQVDLVAGEPLAEFGAADSDRFYSDQERLVQWLWGATDDRVTNRGRPLTLDEETDSCVDSENIDIDGEAATVDVTIADGCAVELSLVTYVKSEPGFDRETASEQELYDTTTATVGPGQYTFTVAVPASE